MKTRRFTNPALAGHPLWRGMVAVACVAGLGGFMAFETLFAPKAELWPRWLAHDPASAARIDHDPWDKFLGRYLKRNGDGVTRLAYGRVTAADKKLLHGYLDGLRKTPIGRYNRDEQLAYWINLYNALAVRLVIRYSPVASIQDIDISPGLFGRGPWERKLLEVDGEPVSLNDIEHRILRPIWGDPRIHYGVNCAAVGCPSLLPRAFTAANAETLLEYGARLYVNDPRGARVENGRLTVSKIYAWFQEDFGGSEQGVIAHLRRHADPTLARALAGVTTIQAYEYDWRLNGQENHGGS